jgi:FkbM family methyltransferase
MHSDFPRWSQSQFGEIEHLLEHALNSFIRNKIVVDVGAADTRISNSIDLIRYFGFYGLLIEANPELSAKMLLQTEGLNCRVVTVAVGPEAGKGKLYLGVNDHISSLDKSETESWGPIYGQIDVEIQTLQDILKSESIPKRFGLLSIDIEGLDLKVLDSLLLNSKYRPEIIIFEFGSNAEQAWLAPVSMLTILKEYIVIAISGPNVILRFKGNFVKRIVRVIKQSKPRTRI